MIDLTGLLWCIYCCRFWPMRTQACSCGSKDFRYVTIEQIEQRFEVCA